MFAAVVSYGCTASMPSVNGLLAALLLCAGAEGSTLAFSASDGRSATLVMAGQDVFSFASGALILHLPLEFLDAPTANEGGYVEGISSLGCLMVTYPGYDGHNGTVVVQRIT